MADLPAGGDETGSPAPAPPTLARPAAGPAAGTPPPAPPTIMRDGRHAVPPTVVRDGTGAAPPTLLRGGLGAAPPTVLRDGQPAGCGEPDGAFPAELRGDYEPRRICGSGSEAEVWHARRVADGQDAAVKVYRPGTAVDLDLLRYLDDPRFRRHVPELHGFGHVRTVGGMVGWVAMEYLPTTLAGLMAQEAGPDGAVPEPRARELVAELARTLRFWQDPEGLDRTPIDVKPDNFGVRRERPAELVVLDFGGVVRQTVTQLPGLVNAAQAYMSPEGIIGERRRASPWWSLGVIARQLATGEAQFRQPDGQLVDEHLLRRETALGEADVSQVSSERWQLLIAGLLTRHPDDRWGAGEVEEWLAGGSPPVARTLAAARQRANAPLNYRGDDYWERAGLAERMLSDSAAAAEWLQDQHGRLESWLRNDLTDDYEFDLHFLTAVSRARPASAALAVLAFGAAYAPHTIPAYRGHQVDASGISALCAGGQAHSPLLRELLDNDVLPVAARYACPHSACRAGGRCSELDRVAAQAPRVAARVRADAAVATGRALDGGEQDMALRTASQLIIAGRARSVPGRLGYLEPDWWTDAVRAADRADPRTEDGIAAITTAVVLNGRALSARAQARQQLANRARARTAAARRAAGTGVIGLAGLALLYWSAAAAAFAICIRDSKLLDVTAAQAGADRFLGASAAASVSAALPALAVVAVVIALSRHGRRMIVPAAVGVAALGLAAVRTPRFPFSPFPALIGGWLASGSAAWHLLTGIAAALICPVAAIVCLAAAARLAREDGAGGLSARLAGLPSGAARLVTGLASLAVLEAVLWATTVIRLTVSGPATTGAAAGAAGAAWQSGLLLVCAAVAALAALLRPASAYRLLIAAAGAAVVLTAAGPLPASVAQVIWHPVAVSALRSLAGLWGSETFWAAVVLAVPAAVAGLRLVAGQRRGARR